MKIKINNYTFNKTAKTVTFTDSTIRLDSVLLIVNATDNIIIFNFADPLKGGMVGTNILTLTYDTSSMDNGDKLLIYYDDVDAEDFDVVLGQETISSLTETLQELSQRLAPLAGAMEAGNSRLRVVAPSTAVTGPATSAQVVAALLTQTKQFEQYSGNAVRSNINNVEST